MTKIRHHFARHDALITISIASVFAGALAAVIILLFRIIIDLPLSEILSDGGNGGAESFESLDPIIRFLLPFGGGVLLGLFFSALSPRHHSVGIAHVVHAINNQHGVLPLKSAVVQFFAGGIAILTGQAGGREGPAVHLGAAINSWAARQLHLPNNSSRVLISCGVAAAISASFNTPIAGVIFAMEVVMLEYTIIGFTPVILAAITATLITRASFGSEPMFIINSISMTSFEEVFFVALIGLTCGVAAALFITIQKFCLRFSHLRPILRLSFVGLITGIGGVVVPQVLGLGYDTLQSMLLNEITITILASLIVAKLIVTAIATGLGMPLGYIGPSLIIGAAIGSLLGAAGIEMNPELASERTLYVLLGMGALMGALINAPLAALLAVVELTNNPNIILPGMLAIVSATLTCSGLFRQNSAVQATLSSQGFKIINDPLSQALQRAAVTSLMDQNYRRLNSNIPMDIVLSVLNNRPRWLLAVDNDGCKRLLNSNDLNLFMQEYKEKKTETYDSGSTPITLSNEELDTTANENRKKDQKGEQSPHPNLINLLEIPGRQLSVANVHPQATLREALEIMDEQKADALHITSPSMPFYNPPSGIITREDIENYTRYPQGIQ